MCAESSCSTPVEQIYGRLEFIAWSLADATHSCRKYSDPLRISETARPSRRISDSGLGCRLSEQKCWSRTTTATTTVVQSKSRGSYFSTCKSTCWCIFTSHESDSFSRFDRTAAPTFDQHDGTADQLLTITAGSAGRAPCSATTSTATATILSSSQSNLSTAFPATCAS